MVKPVKEFYNPYIYNIIYVSIVVIISLIKVQADIY